MKTVKEAIAEGTKLGLKDTLEPFIIIGKLFNILKTSIAKKVDIILKKGN